MHSREEENDGDGTEVVRDMETRGTMMHEEDSTTQRMQHMMCQVWRSSAVVSCTCGQALVTYVCVDHGKKLSEGTDRSLAGLMRCSRMDRTASQIAVSFSAHHVPLFSLGDFLKSTHVMLIHVAIILTTFVLVSSGTLFLLYLQPSATASPPSRTPRRSQWP